MAKKDEKIKRYFSHDIDTDTDEKIADMTYFFRKNTDSFDLTLLPYAALGVFWRLVEHLHKNNLISVEKIHILADEMRINQDFLKIILEKFELFEKRDGYYVSNRVLKNLELQKEKSARARENANKRWEKRVLILDETKEIYELYKKISGKNEVVSDEKLFEIQKITKKYDLDIKKWEKIFKNAKRGWLIDGKKIPITFKKIIENWDDLLNDEAYLAPRVKDSSDVEQEEIANEKLKTSKYKKTDEIFVCSYDQYRVLNAADKIFALDLYFAEREKSSEIISIKKMLTWISDKGGE